MNASRDASRHMEILSRLMIRAYCPSGPENMECTHSAWRKDLQYAKSLSRTQRSEFVQLADSNHVIVRALAALESAAQVDGETTIADWCHTFLEKEQARINRAMGALVRICSALERGGCPVAVIKSLDHWPDLGSDLDLYTVASASEVEQVMKQQFCAEPAERSWGDRLARKWNYRVPGLPELVEIHVQYLGQTGEHETLARRVINRRRLKNIGAREFLVAAPEERLVISALQRVYRHFYFRLCDMVDNAILIRNGEVDFAKLSRAAASAGVWPGVATFLCLIQNYVRSCGGELILPDHLQAAARSAESRVRFENGFLRVSRLTGARLYGSQLVQAGLRRDTHALSRLPLLPPLAITAMVAYRLTGNDKGIW